MMVCKEVKKENSLLEWVTIGETPPYNPAGSPVNVNGKLAYEVSKEGKRFIVMEK